MTIIQDYLEDPFDFISNVSLQNIIKLIKDANDQYYNNGNPIMSDEEYDLLKDELQNRDSNHKLLKQIGNKTHSKDKIKLPYHMGSMDKIKPGTSLIDKWLDKYEGSYVLSDKLDGSSGLLVMREDGKHMLFTRGDGIVGTNITSMLSGIKGIPDININLVIRGELIISKNTFLENKHTYTNARAMVNGLVGKKNITKKELSNVEFVAYEVIEPYDSALKQLQLLKKLKFNTVHFKEIKQISEDYLSSYFKERKKESNYDIDGIIITDNKKYNRNKIGNPKYAFAFKELLEDQIVETEVTKVEWRISKDGYIKPRVHVKPTLISGITITHVTGHNAKNIVDNGIGVGTQIKLTRAGEVIPYILEVIQKVIPSLPTIPYKWNNTNVDFIVDKDNMGEDQTYAILVKTITYFFKKIDVKFLDEKNVTKMIDGGLDNIYKIINASVEDFLEIDGFKDKMATKIYDNIQNAIKEVELSKLMSASNLFGHGLGARKLELIINEYPDILKINLSKHKFIEKIIEIQGFDTKTATQFVNNIDSFKDFLIKNKKIKIKIIKKSTNKSGIFKDIKIVFTGFRDNQLEKIIDKEGGTITATVSCNTHYVVTNDKEISSSKLDKAYKLNIPIMTKNEFLNKFNLKSSVKDI